MIRIRALQNVVTSIRYEFEERIPDAAINIFLTVALEPGVKSLELESKLDLSHDVILRNIEVLMTLCRPNYDNPGLIYMEQDGALRLSPGGKNLTGDLS